MSISQAFRVLTLVLAAVLVPATALAGTTATAPAAPNKAAHMKAAKLKGAKIGKVTKITKAKGAARPKLRVKKH